MQEVKIDSFNTNIIKCKKCDFILAMMIGDKEQCLLKNADYNENHLCNKCNKDNEK